METLDLMKSMKFKFIKKSFPKYGKKEIFEIKKQRKATLMWFTVFLEKIFRTDFIGTK